MKTKQFYLDHNSTSPLSKKVKDFLKGGEVDFLNPNSLHPIGQSAQAAVYEVSQYLHQFFHVPEDDFFIIFHSGVTEALNLFAHHFAMLDQGQMKCFASDHPCAYEQVQRFGSERFEIIKTNREHEFMNGDFSNHPTLLNWTVVNNLSGHVLDGAAFQSFKQKFIGEKEVFLHVDAAQLVGKTHLSQNIIDLFHEADFISFSGHKFGAMKGIGFSFIKNKWKKKLIPFLYGGEQNFKLRASTLNVLGIYSLKLALEDFDQSNELLDNLQEFKGKIQDLVNNYLEWSFPFANFPHQSVNTVSFCHQSIPSDRLLPGFYNGGLFVSPGSACTSGAAKPNFYLEALGFKQIAKNLIRISLGPDNSSNQHEILSSLSQVLDNIKKM